MIDINNTLDLVKLKFYNEWLYTAHIYDEGEAPFHKELTKQMVETYIDPMELAKDALIMDMGCGVGYFLDEMKERGYTNTVGVSLSPADVKVCRDKGHTVKEYDMSFIPQIDGYYDETVDFLFCRHSLEHSPYPILTLVEYNRLLKLKSKIYIEVPAPDCDRKHEYNVNHYSILGETQWAALIQRTGFAIENFNTLDFTLEMPIDPANPDGEKKTISEKYFVIVASKQKPLDIK
jgi:SAM-dependent methyltransferase